MKTQYYRKRQLRKIRFQECAEKKWEELTPSERAFIGERHPEHPKNK